VKKTATTSTVLLKHHLKALRLPTVLAECEKVAQRCAADNVDHLGFLLQLIELELLDREQRAAERRLKAARFPTVKTLEDFDFAAQPSLNKVLVAELMRGGFVEQRESVILLGNPGTGKTHLAIALSIKACQAGHRVAFATAQQRVDRLEAAQHRNALDDELKRIERYALIIVDEIGYLPLERQAANLLFALVARRYERGSIIVTSNRGFEAWGEILGDAMVAAALIDRLVHHAHMITLKGKSYRLRERGTNTTPKVKPSQHARSTELS